MADARNSRLVESGEKSKSSWLDSKWSPIKVLTDTEYENMLREKLLKVNAEIALVDDNIEALRAQQCEMAAQKASKKPGSSTSK
jgi:predicted house-cleaning noncanonical NTP pyrophosphatase (MazG superfamily)